MTAARITDRSPPVSFPGVSAPRMSGGFESLRRRFPDAPAPWLGGHAASAAAVALLVLPVLHPMLRPSVGVASHLLWFVHVLPAGLLAYAFGVRGLAAAFGVSLVGVGVGERLFGAGYGYPADLATIAALVTAVGLTGLLVGVFGLLVRAEQAARLRQDTQLRRAQALSELGEAVASIAHELNNPLASVIAHAELLDDAPAASRALREDLQVIAREARRAADIARGLLARVRTGEAPRDAHDLNAIVSDALAARRPGLSAHGIRVVEHLSKAPLPVCVARGEIEQVVANLLANAEHAMYDTHRGGTVVVRTSRAADAVELSVEDDGPGVALEHRSQLFEPFFTTKPVGVGTGLGLPIARRIARAHGGELRLTSLPGHGARFVLVLPITEQRPALSPTAAVSDPPSVAMDVAPLRRRRILVVDDEPNIRRAVARTLERRGHRVTTVATVAEGLAAANDGDWDLVLCDVQLGAEDGRRLHEELSEVRPGLTERFVFMTGDIHSDALAAVTAAARSRVLAKPFRPVELVALAESG